MLKKPCFSKKRILSIVIAFFGLSGLVLSNGNEYKNLLQQGKIYLNSAMVRTHGITIADSAQSCNALFENGYQEILSKAEQTHDKVFIVGCGGMF
ncbi:hypothetical protein IIA95_04095 [Patescibacteria group bacterium]|nr:hypothetical protein [Patescibacteria group bacterium]